MLSATVNHEDHEDHWSTMPVQGPAAAQVRRIRLEVIDGPDRGLTFSSTSERTVIGTRSNADMILKDPAVSRFHCALTLRESRVELEDLESRNGTEVDGIAVAKVWLRSDATITIGDTRIRFSLGDETVEVALSDRQRFGEMIGSSAAMRAVFARCEKAAATDANVLLQGETGTGKDAAASSIHLESSRKDGPFVVVDCGSIPAGLIESQLFGHEQGAFTGADRVHVGVFEAAKGGTLFLDEIGELPIELQPRLLRALEARTIRRVGGKVDIPIDIRVIAATNRDLQREINTGRFRTDLYFRLAVIEIRLPPLRERRDDLPMLVEHLVSTMGASHEAAAVLRTKDALTALERHAWPGNVRELRNHVERSLATAQPAPLSTPVEDVLAAVDPDMPLRTARERYVRAFERQYLAAVLKKHNGNVSRAARAAGVARVHFYRLMAKSNPSS